MFNALLVRKSDSRQTTGIESVSENDLPPAGASIRVLYSSLNYKDALAVTGRGKIIRGDFPFVPGIDLAGEIVSSDSDLYHAGDLVIATGWGLGEDHWGGFAQRANLHADHLVRMPAGMTPFTAMALGTAGFTAMLSVMAVEEHGVKPEDGEIVVTGATGGVGSIAVLLLSRLGYHVVASTGKSEAGDYLKGLGATRIIARDELGKGPERPLDAGKWAGGIDSVGGDTLAALLSQTKRHSSIAACGLAGGANLNTTVFPFILRGVNLLGIDSNTCPTDRRTAAWQRLANAAPVDVLKQITKTIPLTAVPDYSEKLLTGQIKGRIVVNPNE